LERGGGFRVSSVLPTCDSFAIYALQLSRQNIRLLGATFPFVKFNYDSLLITKAASDAIASYLAKLEHPDFAL